MPQPVVLQENWQYKQTSSGCKITIDGIWQGKREDQTWKQLMSKAGLDQAGPDQAADWAVPAGITKQCIYYMDKQTDWCSGYSCSYTIRVGTTYSRTINITVDHTVA